MRFIIVKEEIIDTSMHPEISVDRESGHVYELKHFSNGVEYLHDKGMLVEESNDVIRLINVMVELKVKNVMKEIKEIRLELRGERY